jgi:hypothetical protein
VGLQTRSLLLIDLKAFYYGGYGVLLMPWVGIVDSYGGKTTEYYSAFSLYLGGKCR